MFTFQLKEQMIQVDAPPIWQEEVTSINFGAT
jgi:hypothetical protein